MSRSIALFRGINVGGHNKIPMAGLRDLARNCGFENPETYIQSGNLVFTAKGDALEAGSTLEKAVAATFGLEVAVIVRTKSEWAKLCTKNPFPDASTEVPAKVHLVVSRARLAPGAAAALAGKAGAGERVEVSGDAVWVHYPEGAGRSKLTPASFDRAMGSPATARNWNTVQKLLEMLDT